MYRPPPFYRFRSVDPGFKRRRGPLAPGPPLARSWTIRPRLAFFFEPPSTARMMERLLCRPFGQRWGFPPHYNFVWVPLASVGSLSPALNFQRILFFASPYTLFLQFVACGPRSPRVLPLYRFCDRDTFTFSHQSNGRRLIFPLLLRGAVQTVGFCYILK